MRNSRVGFIASATTTLLACAALFGGDYDIPWSSLDSGGGTSFAGEFELCGSIGQPDAGAPMTSGDFNLTGGFRAGPALLAPECPADLDGNGAVDFGDLLAILSAWGDCPGCPEDLNGDGNVDFAEILAVLSAWGDCA